MNKKIIAVFCIVILMISVLSACGKNKGYLLAKDEHGVEHAYVTDENGETVLNEDGNVRVYQTDEHGKIVKDEDGNPKENAVDKPSISVNKDGSVTTGIFTLPIIDGWEGVDTGRLVKKGTNENCYILAEYETNETEDTTFALMTDKVISDNKIIVDAINNGDYKDQGLDKAKMKTDRFEYQGFDAIYMSFTIYENSVKVVHHAEAIYFVVADGSVYVINYACLNGEGYDSSFNFLEWANSIKIRTN